MANAKIRHDGYTAEGKKGSVYQDIPGVVGDASKVTHSTHLPGARNETSETIDYVRTLRTGNGTRADTGITETVITASPAVLISVIGNALTAGTSSIRNAAAISGGSTPVLISTFADGLSAQIGIEFDTGITIQGSDALHDVTVIWGDL